jgi:hypothetical protein
VDDNTVIDELLTKLDRKLDDPALQLGVLALKFNDSGKMANTIENIFTSAAPEPDAPRRAAFAAGPVKIETDALNNALIVSASRENLELIQKPPAKTGRGTDRAGRRLDDVHTAYSPTRKRVATILRNLVEQGLYAPARSSLPVPAAVAARRAARPLAISVRSAQQHAHRFRQPGKPRRGRTVIAQVDTKDFAELGNVPLYTLKNARATTLSPVLEQFFRAKQQGEATAVNRSRTTCSVTIVPMTVQHAARHGHQGRVRRDRALAPAARWR